MNTALDPAPAESVAGPDRRQWRRAVGALIRQGARSVLKYRADLYVGLIGAAMQVALVNLVWRAVYGDRSEVAGIDQRVAIGYAVLGTLFNLVFQPWRFSALPQRVQEGTVVFDLLRPVGLITIALGQQFGNILAAIPKGVIGLGLGLLIGALAAPATFASAAAFAVSTLFGVLVALLCNLIVSMTAFWTTDVGGALTVYRMAAAFCSGSLIPLWFMPDGLAAAFRFLPFSAQVFTPLSIYFDPHPGWHTVGELVFQLVWIILLLAGAQLFWRLTYRKVVIHGG